MLSKQQSKSIVVDGKALSLILKRLDEKFLDVVVNVKTVLCSRVTPSQKAAVFFSNDKLSV
jgi:magnesium-transporting ATPase (P-type)